MNKKITLEQLINLKNIKCDNKIYEVYQVRIERGCVWIYCSLPNSYSCAKVELLTNLGKTWEMVEGE